MPALPNVAACAPAACRPFLRACLRAALILCLLVLAGGALAQEALPPAEQMKAWEQRISEVEAAVDSDMTDDALQALRDELQALEAELQAAEAAARPRLQAAREQLEGLGPPPEEGAPPEAPEVAAIRERQAALVAELEGLIKQENLLAVRIDQLQKRISQARLDRFTSQILERGPSPLDPTLWQNAIADRAVAWFSVQSKVESWWDLTLARADRQVLVILGGVVLLAIILNFPLRYWLLRLYSQDPTDLDPSYLDRCAAAIWVASIRSILPIVAIIAVYLTLDVHGLLDDNVFPGVVDLIETLVFAAMLLIFVSVLSLSFLVPDKPAWRVFPLPNRSARRLTWLLIAVAAVFFVNSVSGQALELGRASVSVILQKEFLSSTLIAVLLLIALTTPLREASAEPEEGESPVDEADREGDEAEREARLRYRVPYLRIVLGLVVLAIPVLGLLGYVPLARFVASQLVIAGSIIAGVYVLNLISGEVLSEGLTGHTAFARTIRKSFVLSVAGADVLAFWLSTAITAVLLFGGILLILLVWGIDWSDIAGWLSTLFFGFSIGGFTFSLYGILIGIGLFTGVLALSRLVQGWLEKRVLPRTKLDIGVRNSLKTAVGYLGLIIAAVVAFSYIGLDLSNLAIVAGALSVGIGFGLQSIVNNFVSGLILLAERPIKVGDWIVVGAEQGYVKRISVRATEVETFDRSSVIIPNSNLISDTVKNWTHKDKLGRIIVGVGVAYGTDVEKVRDILLRIARDAPGVAHYPVPFVFFKDFGESSLDFELRCYLRDIDNMLGTSSAIRFAIVKAFNENGITIPFPQRDLHIISEAAPSAPISPPPGAEPPQAEPRPEAAGPQQAVTATPLTIRDPAGSKPEKGVDAAPAGTVAGDADGDGPGGGDSR